MAKKSIFAFLLTLTDFIRLTPKFNQFI